MKSSYSLGVIDLWHKDEAKYLSPDMQVTAVRDFTEPYEELGLLFDYAYINAPAARRKCWWLSKPSIAKNCKVEAMSLHEYMKLQLKESPGMNPFWTLGRIEFFIEFKRLNPDFKL